MANPLVVEVLDQNSAALSGITVNFSVSPSGTLSSTSPTTDTNGQASTTLTLGGTAESYTVTASVSGITPVTFTATATDNNSGNNNNNNNTPVATTLQIVSGNNQSAEINQQLANSLVVKVLDQNSAALSGITVDFSVSPGGTLSSTSPTTDTNGQASTQLTLGSTTGSYTVTASVSGITPVTFTATATDNNSGNSLGEQSHLFYTQNSPVTVQGWLVWIYYPENYKGPRSSSFDSSDYGFNITNLTSGAEITQFAQTVGACDDYDGDGESDKPCNKNLGNPVDGGVYSVQIYIEKEQVLQNGESVSVSFYVDWDQSAANWDGTPATDMTYNLNSDTNMMSHGDIDYNPDHTNQSR